MPPAEAFVAFVDSRPIMARELVAASLGWIHHPTLAGIEDEASGPTSACAGLPEVNTKPQ